LVPEYCPRAYQKIDLSLGTFLSHYRDYDEKVGEKGFPIVDFDPVKLFVKQLRESYSEFALFFYDAFGATDIYVLWKPKAFEPKEFKIVNINGRTLDSSGKKLIPNIEAIVEDFKIIGHELVKNVTIRADKLANFE
jgi:U3 small nucleolar RNA-associated protein 22